MQDMSGQPRAETQPKAASPFWSLFPSIMLPMFLAVADSTIVSAALPSIAAALGGIERVSWIVIAYLVATTIAAPIYGQLRDVLGSRRMMVTALSIFMGASVLCAFAPTVELLAAARVLQGLGGGGLMTLSQALIGETVPPRERARYQGYLAAVIVTASTLGPLVGGLLAEHLGWRSIFFVNVPLGFLAMALVMRLAARAAPKDAWSVDGRGIAYFVGFIVPVLLGVEIAQKLTVAALIAGAVLWTIGGASLWLLLRQEQRAPHPLLRIDLLSRPAIWRSGALAACHGAALVSLVTWLPIYFRVRFGTNAAESGLLLLPLMIGIGTGSMLTGQMVSRTGLTMIFPSIGLIAGVVLLQILSLWAGRLGVREVLPLLLLIGLSFGTVMSVVQLTVQRAAGVGLLGAAAASVQFSRSVGAAVGTAVVGSILLATLALGDAEIARLFRSMIESGPQVITSLTADRQAFVRSEISHAFAVAFFAIGMIACGGLVLAWSHPERRL